MNKKPNMPLLEEIGARIRYFRQHANLSQEALGEKADLHPTYIGQIERGSRNLTVSALNDILGALEISYSVFFESVDVKNAFQSESTEFLKVVDYLSNFEPIQQQHAIAILQEYSKALREARRPSDF